MSEQAQAAALDRAEQRPGAETGGSASREPRVLGLTHRQLAGLIGVVLVANLPLLLYVTRGEAPVTVPVPFQDAFDREAIGPNYFSTGGHWRIEDGQLHSPGVKNNPLWLQAKLPDDVAVELDVRSDSNDGDIKVEIFGNGRDHSSGYVVIFGGWSNTISAITRLDEHGKDRKEDRTLKVERNRTYRMRVERRGTLLRWYLDGNLAMELDDPHPLRGPGHDRFAVSSWDSDLWFDNLSIQPL